MSGLCDRCNEKSSHLIKIGNMPEMAAATRMGYRQICSPCYDDLASESSDRDDAQDDRRAEPRVNVSIAALVEGNTSHFESFSEEMTIVEISRSGLRIHVTRDVETGALLKIRVPEYGLETTAIVEVVWRDSGQQSLGLKLVEPSEEWERLWVDHCGL